MSVKLQFNNLIIPIANIEKSFEGGLKQFLKYERLGVTAWYDKELLRIGSMDNYVEDLLTKILKGKGLIEYEIIDGEKYCKDFAVISALSGGYAKCNWLDLNCKSGGVAFIGSDHLVAYPNKEFLSYGVERDNIEK